MRAAVRVLVDDEASISVNELAGESNVVYEVRVARSDYGKLIGKEGAHAKALRLLLAAASKKYSLTLTLAIVDKP